MPGAPLVKIGSYISLVLRPLHPASVEDDRDDKPAKGECACRRSRNDPDFRLRHGTGFRGKIVYSATAGADQPQAVRVRRSLRANKWTPGSPASVPTAEICFRYELFKVQRRLTYHSPRLEEMMSILRPCEEGENVPMIWFFGVARLIYVNTESVGPLNRSASVYSAKKGCQIFTKCNIRDISRVHGHDGHIVRRHPAFNR